MRLTLLEEAQEQRVGIRTNHPFIDWFCALVKEISEPTVVYCEDRELKAH